MDCVFVQICIGSSCHLKGSQEIVEMIQSYIEEQKLEDYVILSGSFCTGQCNREGVTIVVNDVTYTGITPETFKEFFNDKILKLVKEGN